MEELAGIMWFKRRVLLAEEAKINRSLRICMHALDKQSSTTVKDAVPTEPALAGACVDYKDLVSMAQEELEQRKYELSRQLKVTEKADRILQSGRGDIYKRVLEATVDSLRDFITFDLLRACRCNLAEIRHHEAIKSQVFGEGINMPLMQNFSRYETHLDRKFERTLAMLIKLKELKSR